MNVRLTITLVILTDDANCRDQIWVLSPIGRLTLAQWALNNEFVENWLENWALINQTNVKVDPDDKRMKLDRFVVKKIVLGTVRGDQFLYISFKFDYKVSSRLLQCFSLDFWSPILIAPPYYIFFPLFLSTLHMQARLVDLNTCPISPFLYLPKGSLYYIQV